MSVKVPQHIAIVMDGNRRWAKQNGLEMIKGPRRTTDKIIEELADHCIERGIQYLTLWAFSTENWNRSRDEVELIMDLFKEMLGKKIDQLHEKGIKIKTIGDLSRFDQDIQEEVARGVEKTRDNQKLTLTFALNYGGRDELVRAVQKIINDQVPAVEVTQEKIAQYLDTAGMPDPELIIRPGGEERLSGWLLWQSEYSELYFTDVLMPDFGAAELDKAIVDYQQRNRRFGE